MTAPGWFDAPDYWLGRLLFERGLGVVYLLAFVNALSQFRPLLGDRGLLPARHLLERSTFWETPSLFHWRYSDAAVTAAAGAGAVLSVAVVAGLAESAPAWALLGVWFALWALYQSIVNVGQIFYGFGWESMLLEAGFLALFLGPDGVAPPWAGLLMIRWMLFRTEFGAGMIKMRGDRCWRDLTCLHYHHETQPLPNPLSWFFHHLPGPLHRVEVLGNHVTQLVLPFGLFLPQPVAGICAAVMIVTQLWLMLSGNFAWLNLLTISLAFSALDDGTLRHLLPLTPPPPGPAPSWFAGWVLAGAALVAVLSWWPARNLVSRRQRMNTSFNPFHLVNTYGAFGSVTRARHEVVVEGTRDPHPGPESAWEAYEFRAKPGDPARRPRQIAPYHLRLDWLMWFAAMTSPRQHRWFLALLLKLLEGDRRVIRLLRRAPFGEAPPAVIRSRLYRYRFSTPAERRRTGAWWQRELLREYFPPVRRTGDGQVEVLETPAGV